MVYPSALYVTVQDGIYDITNLNSSLYLTNTHSVSAGTVNVYQTAGIQLRQYQRAENNEHSFFGGSARIMLSVCEVLQLDPYLFPGKGVYTVMTI